jgi:hypothetical protein
LAPTCTVSLPLSLAALWGHPISAVSSPHALSFSLPRGPHPSVPSASLTSRPRSPAVVAPTTARSPATSARPRPFRPHALLAHSPLLICALNQAPTPPLSLCARDQPSSVAAHQGLPSFCDSRCACIASVALVSSASPSIARDTPRFAPSPSGLPGPRSHIKQSISCEKQTIQIKFLTLQDKPKHLTCRGTPFSHTSIVHIDSPFVARTHCLGVQCPTAPDPAVK